MDLPEYKVRVIAPRVGGGFGPKGGFYPENFLVPWLAVRLGTTVKWIEDRHEHFIASRQERDQPIGSRPRSTKMARSSG